MNAVITTTAKYVPERTLTNFDLEKMVDTSDEWIQSRTGIKERRLVEKGQATSDLATLIANQLLIKSGKSALDIARTWFDMNLARSGIPDMNKY